MDFVDVLYKWIDDYCKRHNYQWFEIDYDRKAVFYYSGKQEESFDYECFDYTEVDLFN